MPTLIRALPLPGFPTPLRAFAVAEPSDAVPILTTP